MKTSTALFATVAVLLAAGLGFVVSGVYDIGADAPHWRITEELVEVLRERSVAARAGAVQVPDDLGDPQRLRRGAGNYDAMCAGCHLRPGVADSEIRKGLYPQPPALASADIDHAGDPGRQFWIIKHGIKLTAMPAWALGGVDDATIWDIVALLRKMPALSAQAYEALVATSEGHSHAGAEHGDGHTHEQPGTDGHGEASAQEHVAEPGAPPHSHEQHEY